MVLGGLHSVHDPMRERGRAERDAGCDDDPGVAQRLPGEAYRCGEYRTRERRGECTGEAL